MSGLNTYHCAVCHKVAQVDPQRQPVPTCCKQTMKPGQPPPQAPNWAALKRTQGALDAVEGAIGQVGPQELAQLKADLQVVEDRIAQHRALGKPDSDLEALEGNPLGYAQELRAQVQEKDQALRDLEGQKAQLLERLGPMDRAAKAYRLRQLQERESKAWPGEQALRKALKDWADKHSDAIRKEHEARLKERRELGVGTKKEGLPLLPADPVGHVLGKVFRSV